MKEFHFYIELTMVGYLLFTFYCS